MVRTPWGNAAELRERKLNPRLDRSDAEREESQRRRLFGAMVAAMAMKGYAATTVSDLSELSGVSRATFYELFGAKERCFAAMVEEVLGGLGGVLASEYEQYGSWEERSRGALERLAELIDAEPAAARACLLEAYAAGPPARAPLERVVAELAGLSIRARGWSGPRYPDAEPVARAAIGGLTAVLYGALARGEQSAPLVQGLWEWTSGFAPPPGPLAAKGRRPRRGRSAALGAHMPAERILRGLAATVAERGYGAARIEDVASAASASKVTFYQHFTGKEDAFAAALDSSGAQLVAATLPALRRAGDWGQALRTALEASFGFLAFEPDFARLRCLEAYAAGPWAVAARDSAWETILDAVLELGPDSCPRLSRLEREATIGAIEAIAYERIEAKGPQALPGAVPLAVYAAAVPFVGAERAYAVATS
jgi:AcrR family transcriptional regulator